jgi:hypothetical protein
MRDKNMLFHRIASFNPRLQTGAALNELYLFLDFHFIMYAFQLKPSVL